MDTPYKVCPDCGGHNRAVCDCVPHNVPVEEMIGDIECEKCRGDGDVECPRCYGRGVVQNGEVRVGKTIYTDSSLTSKLRILQKQGESAFELIAPELNKLQPGRERTEEEFKQICISLALLLHYLIGGSGERE